jgi:hypothetical protein
VEEELYKRLSSSGGMNFHIGQIPIAQYRSTMKGEMGGISVFLSVSEDAIDI